MENDTLLAALFTITMIVVTFQAWRLGNEKRDVALLGVISGLTGAGTAATWVL